VTLLWRARLALRQETRPIAKKLLRPAGESLRKRIEELDEKINEAMLLSWIATAGLILATLVIVGLLAKRITPASSLMILIIGVVITAAIWGLLVWKLMRFVNLRRDCRLGSMANAPWRRRSTC
jgi:K+-sensing histidine kinase KdpD